MIPLYLALPALLGCAAIGWGIDRALGAPFAGRGALAWSPRVLAGLVLALALALHPLAALAMVGLLALAARARPAESRPAARRTPETGARSALACIAGFALVAWARPAVPLAWDEHVWLAKVRLGLGLRAAALDPTADVIPRGYPILASLAEAALAMFRDDLGALVAGATALVVLAFALALTELPRERRVPLAIALALVPLAWIHARSAYLDLVVGLLSLAVLAALLRAREGETPHAAILAAFLLAGVKDEGAAHVIAVAVACALATGERRAPALVAAAALVSAGTWRVLLALAGVDHGDHALEGAGLVDAPAIATEVVRGATDVLSWGATWPLALAASVVCVRRGDPRARAVVLALALSFAVLLTGILAGSERVRAFALDGTLVNRLLMQLLPLAAWTVLEAIAIAGAPDQGRRAGGGSPSQGGGAAEAGAR